MCPVSFASKIRLTIDHTIVVSSVTPSLHLFHSCNAEQIHCYASWKRLVFIVKWQLSSRIRGNPKYVTICFSFSWCRFLCYDTVTYWGFYSRWIFISVQKLNTLQSNTISNSPNTRARPNSAISYTRIRYLQRSTVPHHVYHQTEIEVGNQQSYYYGSQLQLGYIVEWQWKLRPSICIVAWTTVLYYCIITWQSADITLLRKLHNNI
jgi:hypothetical protein